MYNTSADIGPTFKTSPEADSILPSMRSLLFCADIVSTVRRCVATFGMLTASLYSTMAGMYLPGKYSLIHSFEELAFIKPVFVGDVLTVEGGVIDKDNALGLIRIKVTIRNQNNKVVSRAKMKVLVMK